MPQRPTSLIALHGFTLNGQIMKRQMGKLDRRLAEHVNLVYPTGHSVCPDELIARLYNKWNAKPPPGPHCRWWHASDDGSTYDGWDKTQEHLRILLEEHAPAGLIGFSQGAIVATAAAALSQSGRLPPLEFVVLVAGARPRSDDIAPFLKEPVALPSLHVWGTKDKVMGRAPAHLVDSFSPEQREVQVWEGTHEIPRRGAPADAIVSFVERQCKNYPNL